MKTVKTNTGLNILFDEKITAAQVPELMEQIKIVLEEDTDYSVVTADFSGVEYIDSTGITLVIDIYKTVDEMGKSFSVTGAGDEIKNLFSIIQLDKVFSID